MSISVVIPTFNRVEALLDTIAAVKDCHPAPDEIIVHVDAGDNQSRNAVLSDHADVNVMQSSVTLGPGGSRNRLLKAARNEIVVSLDDDSFPIDDDFFATVEKSVSEHSEAAVIAMNIIHDDEPMIERSSNSYNVADFVGCGCVYKKSAFLETQGYVPIQPAYGVEEADLALQLLDRGWSIVHDDSLRVRHATDRAHQTTPVITSAHISNVALLASLRYPKLFWPLGTLQVANRCIYSIKKGSVPGVLDGLAAVPSKIWRFRRYRRPVSITTIFKVRRLRRRKF